MKTEQLKHAEIKALSYNELIDIEGGGLSYDIGRAIRFMGINIGYGGGPVGISMAIADSIHIKLKNQ